MLIQSAHEGNCEDSCVNVRITKKFPLRTKKKYQSENTKLITRSKNSPDNIDQLKTTISILTRFFCCVLANLPIKLLKMETMSFVKASC